MKQTLRIFGVAFSVTIMIALTACGGTSPPTTGNIVEVSTSTKEQGDLPDCCKKGANEAGRLAKKIEPASGTAGSIPKEPPAGRLENKAKSTRHPEIPDSILEPWDAPNNREELDLAIHVIDQAGSQTTLDKLNGKPVIASFIFTRCANPAMCPAIAQKMVSLQRLIKRRSLSDEVNLALISYDPWYDTPQRMKKYGSDRGLEFTNAAMFTPETRSLRQLMDEFQLMVTYDENNMVANHSMDLFILDSAGRYVRQYQGIWDNRSVLSDLRRLLASERAAKNETAAKTAASR